MPRVLLENDLMIALKKVSLWMSAPTRHMGNNVYQWASVFEADKEPTPEDVAPLRPVDQREQPGHTTGRLETPSSFWPKFEHRFRPAEETWMAEALPAAKRAGVHGHHAMGLFEVVLLARDRLAVTLPSDGRTPSTRAGGQVILIPMRQLVAVMDAFMGYAGEVRSDVPEGRGRKAKRAKRAEWEALVEETRRWEQAGPHENLNY